MPQRGQNHTNKMKYSFIIASYNRLEEVKELITSIDALDYPQDSFELIISDDGSTDGTVDYLRTQSFGYAFQLLTQPNKGPGAARNHGMEYARGDYFLFIDSDCILTPDYLRKLDANLDATHADAFGGPDDCHESFPPLQKAINYSMTSFIGTGGIRGSEKRVAKYYPRTFNMGIRKEVYARIGGMNSQRFSEDMDFSARIYAAGFRVALFRDAFVYHKRRSNLKSFFRQIFNSGVGRINLHASYPDMLKPIHLAPTVVVAGTVGVLLLALLFPWAQGLLWLMLGGMALLACIAFLQSLAKYKNLKVSFLSILTLYIQVYAYGCGSWSGLWQHLILRRKVASGL